MALYIVRATRAGTLPQATSQISLHDGYFRCLANGCCCQTIIYTRRSIHSWTSQQYSIFQNNRK